MKSMLQAALDTTSAPFKDKSTMKYQSGVTSIEYALIAFLIAIAIIVGVGATGEANAVNWNKVITEVNKALGL